VISITPNGVLLYKHSALRVIRSTGVAQWHASIQWGSVWATNLA